MTWGEPPAQAGSEPARPEPQRADQQGTGPQQGWAAPPQQLERPQDEAQHQPQELPPVEPVALGTAALREPAFKVSPRAVSYWRVVELIGTVIVLGGLGAAYILVFDDKPWWATAILALVVVNCLVRVLVMPQIRFRVHRWEVTPTAVYTRSGWLGREQRIAPLSRVQTVDSTQGALMRTFGLASITVTTASAAGPITIACLDKATADRVVADLTAITGRTEGDAT